MAPVLPVPPFPYQSFGRLVPIENLRRCCFSAPPCRSSQSTWCPFLRSPDQRRAGRPVLGGLLDSNRFLGQVSVSDGILTCTSPWKSRHSVFQKRGTRAEGGAEQRDVRFACCTDRQHVELEGAVKVQVFWDFFTKRRDTRQRRHSIR